MIGREGREAKEKLPSKYGRGRRQDWSSDEQP